MTATRTQITIRGVVQGVGFRPFIYNLAERHDLTGWVLNHSGGVEVEVEGTPAAIRDFVAAIEAEAPPLAQIESLESHEVTPERSERFEIRRSERQEGRYQLVAPDTATCADCLREVLDPADRRYRYPFTNCTNCGPRFTIITDIPYDRPSTTMRAFTMCPDCQREYDDPRDRRFHAQPNACPVCGPQVWLARGATAEAQAYAFPPPPADQIAATAALLRAGAIVAIKGLGGFQLACDATNAAAVRTLRARKQRPDKPFAVMIATLDEVHAHCHVSPQGAALLRSPQCPIVLLRWRADSDVVPEVAAGYTHLGVMLPYTPLHHLLLRDARRPLVMTSGNLTEEPIAAENDEAMRRLGHLADAFLLHNREIHARYDDSVWAALRLDAEGEAHGRSGRAEDTIAQPLRRARGYAPFPVRLPFEAEQVLACGPEIKNTFCVTRDQYAFVSQHIGDMENLETLEHYTRTIALYRHLFRVEPQAIAHDLHPDYMATRYALQQAAELGLPALPVQHHHAHLASCLADNGWAPDAGPVIGAIMDGTGYGPDDVIWGGEWLIGDYQSYTRAAHIEALPLPGGDAATRHPWRIAHSYVRALLPGTTIPAIAPGVDVGQIALLDQQIARQINCPLTTAMGRLFDAVSALLGLCAHATYEAQAAIELEHLARQAYARTTGAALSPVYPFEIDHTDGRRVIRLAGLLRALLDELAQERSKAQIALRFHRTAAHAIVETCQQIAGQTGLRTVALSGGCYQNRILLRLAVQGLREAGLEVLLHRQVPCNDGGLSLGQAAIAGLAARQDALRAVQARLAAA
ncbi:MAG: carbamoyltransferase HypF [Anaerolineae bacterium]|nr:carbamoyltransferase HypF [Anaerolineae bacterium]